MTTTHRYTIHYARADGRALPSLAVEPDFEPLQAWARFQAIRCGALPPLLPGAAAVVVPRWDAARGAPWVDGLHVRVAEEHAEIPGSFFQPLARSGASLLVERGELRAGDPYHWRVAAFSSGRTDADEVSASASGLCVQEVEHALPLVDGSLARFLERSEPAGILDPLDVPVFVPEHVIEEAFALARSAGDVETGGILIGHLRRQTVPPEIFVEVTAQIPARHAEAHASSFAFTPETWASASAAVDLRSAGEIWVGWHHYHPWFCRDCTAEQQRDCRFQRPFFSRDDIVLHRTCFPGAHQIALLVSALGPDSLDASFFGWRHGWVVERGVHRLGAASETLG